MAKTQLELKRIDLVIVPVKGKKVVKTISPEGSGADLFKIYEDFVLGLLAYARDH